MTTRFYLEGYEAQGITFTYSFTFEEAMRLSKELVKHFSILDLPNMFSHHETRYQDEGITPQQFRQFQEWLLLELFTIRLNFELGLKN